MPDIIESAPTGRAGCRGCTQKIAKGAVRFGKRFDNPYGEGEATHWFHLECAAEALPDRVEAALADSDARFAGDLDSLLAAGRTNQKLGQAYYAEHATSGRARCQHCRQKIENRSLRVVIAPGGEGPSVVRKAFIHLGCAADFAGMAGLTARLIRTSSSLSEDDQEVIRATLAEASQEGWHPGSDALGSSPLRPPASTSGATSKQGVLRPVAKAHDTKETERSGAHDKRDAEEETNPHPELRTRRQ